MSAYTSCEFSNRFTENFPSSENDSLPVSDEEKLNEENASVRS